MVPTDTVRFKRMTKATSAIPATTNGMIRAMLSLVHSSHRLEPNVRLSPFLHCPQSIPDLL